MAPLTSSLPRYSYFRLMAPLALKFAHKNNDYLPEGAPHLAWAGFSSGFNGQERDDELAGVGNFNTALYWEYDTRLGRRWNLDPVLKPFECGYASFTNNPLRFIDPLGNDSADFMTKDGIPGFNLKEVQISDSKSYKGSLANKLFGDLSNGKQLSEKENPYIFTNKEIDSGVSSELTAISLFTCGGGLVNRIKEGMTSLGWATIGRTFADASLQYAGGYLATGDPGQSFGNINLLQSSLSGLGVNPFSTALTASAFNLNASGKFSSSLTGEISSSQFITQSAIGFGFSYAGGKLINSANFKAITLGTYMNSSLSMGQRIGLGVSNTLYNAPSVGFGIGESFLGTKLSK